MSAAKARLLINGLAIASLVLSLLLQNDALALILVLVCMMCALVVLYRNLALLSNVSEDNPKLETIRSVTIFNAAFIVVVVVLAIMLEKGVIVPTERQSKWGMAAILAVLMVVFGNIAPKLPFNRHTGLRLPWTVRDEDTWVVAHRILGYIYISIPFGILCFVGATAQMPFDTWVKVWFLGPLLAWIGIPGVLSGIFYYKKWNGKLR